MQQDSWDEPGGLGQSVWAADGEAAGPAFGPNEQQYISTVEADEAALVESEGGGVLLPTRSPLSRQGSMTALLADGAANTPDHTVMSPLQRACSWLTATMLLGTLTAIVFVLMAFPSPYQSGVPSCRSGVTVGVLPPDANSSQRLVVWSGRGQGGTVYREWLHSFSMLDLAWERIKEEGQPLDSQRRRRLLQQQGQQRQANDARLYAASNEHKPKPGPLPHGRWKAASTSLSGLGILVHGGSVPAGQDGDSPAAQGGGVYLDDTWLLHADLRWEPAADGSAATAADSSQQPGAGLVRPVARHLHSLVSYQDEEGQHIVVLFGGRRADGLLLNDVWRGVVRWPAINWTLLSDPQSGAGSGPSPLPRSGHAAIMLNATTLLIHGGRSEVYGSFADVWAFSLPALRWQPLMPATVAQPPARDLHAAAAYDGKLLVFGGRYGTLAEAKRPLGDRWVFDVASRTWSMLPVRGLSPLPRLLFGHTQYSPIDGGPDELLVFGGETGAGCKLNDVWSLSLLTHHWTQLSLPAFASRQCQQLFG